MDFFDSVSNSLLGVKEPEKDFFESVSEDLLSEDSYTTEFKDDKLAKESVSVSQSAINWERLQPFFLERDDDDNESSLEQNLFESVDLSAEYFSESTITNLIMNPLSKLRATMSSNSIAKRGKENSKLTAMYKDKIPCEWDIHGIEQAVSMLNESILLFISKFVARELPNKETDYKTLSKVLKEYEDGFKDNLDTLKKTTLYTANKLNSEIMRANDVILNLCGKVVREADKLKSSQDITVDQARLLSRCITIMNKGAGIAFNIFERYMDKYHPSKIYDTTYDLGYGIGHTSGYSAGRQRGYSAGVSAGFGAGMSMSS